jgi:hypothetical protein
MEWNTLEVSSPTNRKDHPERSGFFLSKISCTPQGRKCSLAFVLHPILSLRFGECCLAITLNKKHKKNLGCVKKIYNLVKNSNLSGDRLTRHHPCLTCAREYLFSVFLRNFFHKNLTINSWYYI